MRYCECGETIPFQLFVDGKKRNLKNRTKCLKCSPFGVIRPKKTLEEERARNVRKSKAWRTRIMASNGGIDPIGMMRTNRKNAIVRLMGNKCRFCSYSRLVTNLAFHHVSDKTHPLTSREFQFSLLKMLPELRKCVLCCHNCHGEIHAGLIPHEIVIAEHLACKASLDDLDDKSWKHIL